MKKYVLTIDEATCAKNGKDVNATELLNVMSHYGTVENYDAVEARVKSDFQKVNSDLHAQLNAIKDQELTADEIKMVKAYRENKNAVVSAYIAEVDTYKTQLNAIKTEHEQRVAKLKALLEE